MGANDVAEQLHAAQEYCAEIEAKLEQALASRVANNYFGLLRERNDLEAHRRSAVAYAGRLEEALRELVVLFEGPRDPDYERRKPLAWKAARAALGPELLLINGNERPL